MHFNFTDLAKIIKFWKNFRHFIFNPRRCHKRTLGVEHFYRGHGGDFIDVWFFIFGQEKVSQRPTELPLTFIKFHFRIYAFHAFIDTQITIILF